MTTHPSEAEVLVSTLRSRGKTMSTAESCTGGLIGASVTDIPGASEVFLGGVVSYSNDAKENILGVSHSTLMEHGAVSEQTARQMVEGAIGVFHSDYAVAVTGIAGPGGATPGKPVGLVYIAVADGPRTVVTRNIFNGDRQAVRESTVREACSLLTDMMEGRL
ncbi:MAG: CinA family protein [Candidatus Methanomethylophilaceae archaeon]